MKNLNKIKLLALALFLPAIGFCQEQAAKDTSTYFSNALFLTLITTIIVLAIVIVAFSTVFKNIADSDFLTNKYGRKDNKGNVTSSIIAVILMLSSMSAFAEEKVTAVVKDDGLIGGIDQFTFYFLMFIIFVELLVLGLMFYQFNFLVRTQTTIQAASAKPVESKIIKSLTDAVPIEEEASILLDHDYDGIKELDNNLPPWWKYGFYLTILVAIVYMIHYHGAKTGALQAKEYANEMKEAEIAIAEHMKNSANNVDESSVKMLTAEADLKTGKDLFISTCAACHGQLGEGGVGPNLTDDYWVHGGSVVDIFKTVKYGWPDKGMKSWKEDLSPMQMAQVTSFIKTLRGTNPPKGKEKQGDLYVEEGAPVNDSTVVVADSLKTAMVTDSLKK